MNYTNKCVIHKYLPSKSRWVNPERELMSTYTTTMMIDGREIQLRYLEPTEVIDPARITSVLVVAFDEVKRILAIRNKRGFDIPGGHVETYDATLEETGRREIREEANAILGCLVPSTIIESTYNGTEPEKLTYMLVFTGCVESMGDFVANHEIFERSFLSKQNLIDNYGAGKKEDISKLIEMAEIVFTKTYPAGCPTLYGASPTPNGIPHEM